MGRVKTSLRALWCVWEALQVELHGQYSPARLHEVLQFTESTSFARACATVALTPLPCLIVVLVVEAVALPPPTIEACLWGPKYWLRSIISSGVLTSSTIIQICHAAKALSMTTTRLWVITAIIQVFTLLVTLAANVIIGFPTPFTFQLLSPLWFVQMVVALWSVWKHVLRSDLEARRDVTQYMWHYGCEVALTVVYPLFAYIFSVHGEGAPVLFALVMPVLKVFMKNWARYGANRVEHLTPLFVVFTVDNFHSLFFSSTTKTNHSVGTLAVTATVDWLQIFVAIWEVFWRARHLARVQLQIAKVNSQSAADKRPKNVDAPLAQRTILHRVSETLVMHKVVREHRSITLPRHLRDRNAPLPPLIHITRLLSGNIQVMPVEPIGPPVLSVSIAHPPNLEQMQIELVRCALRLLYIVEFFLLAEFAELAFTAIYAVYLVVIAHLPNRIYYSALKSMTEDQWRDTIDYVVRSTSLELLSFIAIMASFDCILQYSTIKLLAFALIRHWRLVQSLLVLCVFYVLQMSLEHFGNDYTFRFQWLRHPQH